MSRRVHQGPFAVVSDGTLILNVAHVAQRMKPEELLRTALSQQGELFIGVKMSSREAAYVLRWCADIHEEAIAYVVGARARRARKRGPSRPKY